LGLAVLPLLFEGEGAVGEAVSPLKPPPGPRPFQFRSNRRARVSCVLIGLVNRSAVEVWY